MAVGYDPSSSFCFQDSPLLRYHDILGDSGVYRSAFHDEHQCSLLNISSSSERLNMYLYGLPVIGGGSGSLVLCRIAVPDNTVMNPHSSDAMLLTL